MYRVNIGRLAPGVQELHCEIAHGKENSVSCAIQTL